MRSKGKNMRTTKELVAELDANAEGYSDAMLIVGFENTTVYIQSQNPKRSRN
jgi:hypothetical protein